MNDFGADDGDDLLGAIRCDNFLEQWHLVAMLSLGPILLCFYIFFVFMLCQRWRLYLLVQPPIRCTHWQQVTNCCYFYLLTVCWQCSNLFHRAMFWRFFDECRFMYRLASFGVPYIIWLNAFRARDARNELTNLRCDSMLRASSASRRW